jgi:hypothetical protein
MAVVSGIAVGDDDVGERGVVEGLAKLDLGELVVLCNAVSQKKVKKRQKRESAA